ncbi:MAG: hypothetical protein ACM3U2_15485 [Deltaproteobacteria bacterium]
MDLILRGYHLNDPTWFYLSFLLILAVYFKFSRFWSIRNLDLVLLLSISPGLLLVRDDERTVAAFGFAWLFLATALLLVRALSDGLITRRPRLEQNMNAAGMVFLCAATFLFLTTKLLTEPAAESAVASVRRANELVQGKPASPAAREGQEVKAVDTVPAGPAASLVAGGVAQISKVVAHGNSGVAASAADPDVVTARLIAILAHLAVIVGLTLVGRHIFGDPDVGFAMATLYMLLPCTAYDVGKINHVLPAALVVWAIWAYRRPFVSGALLGLACAMMFFPIFLLPLWGAFYGRRGGLRFGTAVVLTTGVILSCLMLLSHDSQTVARAMLGYVPLSELLNSASKSGWWRTHDVAYVVPVFVSYLVMLVALTIWPRRKSLAHVIPASAAIVIGTQFWYLEQGGVYVLWYLPLLLLVVFRPLMTNHFAPELKPLQMFHRVAGQAPPQPELVGSSAGTAAPNPGDRG